MVSAAVISFVLVCMNLNAQGAVSRDFADICQDTQIHVGGGVFEGGHYTGLPNWAPDGDGFLAVVSRDDLLVPQRFWDCSNDIVSGSVTARKAPGQSVALGQSNLKYVLPLEVWTWENGTPGIKVLDGGVFEATYVRKFVMADPLAPLNATCILAPQPCGTYFVHIAGDGIAFGTGDGEFYEGQMVRVKVTQTYMFQRNRPDKEFPNWDGWPVEKVTLTPIN
jgi:hypothetical protein